MKIVHLAAESRIDVLPVVVKALELLDKKHSIAIVTTVQYVKKLDDVENLLKKNGFKAKKYPFTLGCKVPKIKEDIVLYIGTGKFHPKGIIIKTKKDIVMANPETEEVEKLTNSDVELLEKRKKGALLKFHTSENIGVLISVKSGQKSVQQLPDDILKLKNKFKDKKFYFFCVNTLDFNELENFPFVDMWINTMCPRIGYDDTIRLPKPLLNLEDLE